MASLYIIRGVPGSGKTTLGQRLKKNGLVRYVVSADDYMTGPDGKYLFQPSMLKLCHEECRIAAHRRIIAGYSVAVCNTFTRVWEMQPYVDLARNEKCDLFVIRCEGGYRNVHGVPEWKVADMRRRFEDWPKEIDAAAAQETP